MTKEQAESKLREYNNWMLLYLTMHEALPGHYTQFEHANNLQPSSRRVLRVLLGNGPYGKVGESMRVKEMEDAGYANHDPRFVLMVQKIRLRVITNAILDIRMQSRNMTDQEALDLMEKKAFQTEAEAQGKLRRAKLTAGQLILIMSATTSGSICATGSSSSREAPSPSSASTILRSTKGRCRFRFCNHYWCRS